MNPRQYEGPRRRGASEGQRFEPYARERWHQSERFDDPRYRDFDQPPSLAQRRQGEWEEAGREREWRDDRWYAEPAFAPEQEMIEQPYYGGRTQAGSRNQGFGARSPYEGGRSRGASQQGIRPWSDRSWSESDRSWNDQDSQAGYGRKRGLRGRGPKGYERSDDRIREDICDRLAESDDIDPSEVEVKVSKGEVSIEGTVDERRTKHAIEDLCDSVSGVKDVRNGLRVRQRRDDSSASERSGSGAGKTRAREGRESSQLNA